MVKGKDLDLKGPMRFFCLASTMGIGKVCMENSGNIIGYLIWGYHGDIMEI